MAIKNYYRGNHHPAPFKKQTGAALLAFMLVIVVGSTFSFTKKLNANLFQTQGYKQTGFALQAAKEALLGYAVSYPDQVNSLFGPGYLLCPDRNNNGSASGSCSLTGATSIGRFPYKTLETEELRDGHGERLWYVVSDKFRNNPKTIPLNSETAGDSGGDMTVRNNIGNNYTDIAAVIFSADTPLDTQNRTRSNENDHTHYIEATFTDSDSDGITDTIITTDTDKYIVLTKDELMRAVEKRVLGEVKQALLKYQTDHDAFPWLATFADPSSSAFRGEIGMKQGHIPFHYSQDTTGVSGRNPLQSTVRWEWNVGGTVNTTHHGDVKIVNCLKNVDCPASVIFPQLFEVETLADCTWTNKNTVDCASTGFVLASSVVCDFGCGDATCTREYEINMPSYTVDSDANITINKPTDSTVRTRNLFIEHNAPDSLPSKTAAIKIKDTYIGDDYYSSCSPSVTRIFNEGSIDFTAATTGTLKATGIQYDIDLDEGELPTWFFENEWHHLIYIAYASGESLPGGTALCTAGADCIMVNNENNVRAIVLSAGETLTGQNRDSIASPGIDDYFEGENADLNINSFVKNRITNDYNDKTKVISIVP